MATIQTGRYNIVNVKQQTIATLSDPNDGTPVSGETSNFVDVAKVSTYSESNSGLTDILVFSGTSFVLQTASTRCKMLAVPTKPAF